jgi:hypothetical protein
MVGLITLSYFEYRRNPSDITSKFTPRCHLGLLGYKVVLVIFYAILNQGK